MRIFDAQDKNIIILEQLLFFQRQSSEARLSAPNAKETLEEIFSDLNSRYFSGSIVARIRWGRYGHRKKRVRRRSVRLGAYFFQSRVIRIHPILAHDWVPRPVLETVIHHEMCHAAAPTQQQGPQRRHHHEDFRKLEREFEHHAWTKKWLKENLGRMLQIMTSAPKGQGA